MTYHVQGDTVNTVLWYREENPEPIYTYDARDQQLYHLFISRHFSCHNKPALGQFVKLPQPLQVWNGSVFNLLPGYLCVFVGFLFYPGKL